MTAPDIAVSVTTYQKPWHLRRVLASLAGQRGVEGRMEVVVTDDGSADETAAIVERFRREAPFSVAFTTHPHSTFHPARSRNEGARATAAPYLLFVDGDCVLPPDHVATHLARRRPGRVMLGDCYRAEQEISATLSEEGAARGEFLQWELPGEQRRLHQKHRKYRFYSLTRRSRIKLVSNNVGVWRADFERVNGFDENFQGWGQEDDDLGQRLRRIGVRLESILAWTRGYHLWHPRDPSATEKWQGGVNVPYFLRRGRLTRCRNGLLKRGLADLSIRVVGQPEFPERLEALWREAGLPPRDFSRGSTRPSNGSTASPELEILCLPGEGRFSGRAECQILLLDGAAPTRRTLAAADRIVADRHFPDLTGEIQFPLSEFGGALESAG